MENTNHTPSGQGEHIPQNIENPKNTIAKYSVLLLFVALPFIGFWVGTTYQDSPSASLAPKQIEIFELHGDAFSSTCFVDREFETVLDTSGWGEYSGYGFRIKYPVHRVTIERLPYGDEGSQVGVVEYKVTSMRDEQQSGSIKAYRLDREIYKARFMHSSPVTYELHSDSWWVGALNRWDAKEVEQCLPNSVADTLDGQLPIYATSDGDVGHGFMNYFVVLRDTPGTDSYEPLIIEFSTSHVGDGYSQEYYSAEEELSNIVKSMVETLELRPAHKG